MLDVNNIYDTPLPYQDLANYTMGPMNIMGTSFLGGVKMNPQLTSDKFTIIKKKDQESKRTLKNILKGAAVLVGAGLTFSFFRNIKKSGGIIKYFKNLFGSKPASTSKWSKVKNWFSGKWNTLKSKFKRTPSTP